MCAKGHDLSLKSDTVTLETENTSSGPYRVRQPFLSVYLFVLIHVTWLIKYPQLKSVSSEDNKAMCIKGHVGF